ncbi:MAG: hypothetical protein ACTSWY_03195 [Promethearchaeota archaeon]
MTQVNYLKNYSTANKKEVKQAKFSKDYRYIIDSDGNKVKLNDSRVVFVEPAARNPYGKRFVENFYKIIGRNIRIADDTTHDILQYSKKICSGRECLASVGIAGAILKDINEYRKDNEITLYQNPMNQHGPCQNGNWPLLYQNFTKRLNVKNIIIGVSPSHRNHYLGMSKPEIILFNILFSIGHYLVEVKNALQCVAQDKESAINKFEEQTDILVEKVENEKILKNGLKDWSKQISKIPLKKSVKETPKVLIFGGLNLLFCHYPVEDYFLKQQIIPKVVDIGETMEWLFSERAVRYGFKRGFVNPKKQLSIWSILFSFFRNNTKEAYKALESQIRVFILNRKSASYRRILEKTGLLFDDPPSFKDLARNSYKYVSHNGFTETSITTGRFLHSVKSGVYDGYVNLGSFNCAPAMNSQALVRPIANKLDDIAYIALDVEGPWLSTNQRRLLETIAIQIKRIHNDRNKGT